jgi:anion-transporting  ArsA/GET3 family ATPase
MNLLDRQLLFVTGKGGVGKSTVAAALCLLGAQSGKRTLAVEVDQKGNLTDFFEHDRVGYQPVEVQPNLWAFTENTEDALEEYLRIFLKMPVLSRVGPVARIFDFVATAAPGVREILVTGKITYEARERRSARSDVPKWDLIVVDSQATGHIVAQLEAHRTFGDLVQVGIVRQQTEWMGEILEDPARTGVVIVATPEEMPVSETIDLYHRFAEGTHVDITGVVVNRVLPEIFGRREEEVFEALARPEAAQIIEEAIGADPAPYVEAARLSTTLRRTRAAHMRRLREELPLPLIYVPYLFVRSHGMRTTRLVADYLAEELS